MNFNFIDVVTREEKNNTKRFACNVFYVKIFLLVLLLITCILKLKKLYI